jgi:hypothetical protein
MYRRSWFSVVDLSLPATDYVQEYILLRHRFEFIDDIVVWIVTEYHALDRILRFREPALRASDPQKAKSEKYLISVFEDGLQFGFWTSNDTIFRNRDVRMKL